MEKSVLHYTAMKDEVDSITSAKQKKAVIKWLKKEEKWLLNSDYLALIQYKQLAMEKYGRSPTELKYRILQWESMYRQRCDPSMSVKPTNYFITGTIPVEDLEVFEVDDADDDGGLALELLTRVPAYYPLRQYFHQ